MLLLAQVATPATSHFGEAYQSGPGPTWKNLVATPHVWEGALFYLAAMALSTPERFNPEERAFPLPSAASGCGCGPERSGSPLALLGIALLFGGLWNRAWARFRAR